MDYVPKLTILTHEATKYFVKLIILPSDLCREVPGGPGVGWEKLKCLKI